MSARILAVANQKGGVGKTTTAINLATALAVADKQRILLVDMDPQANLTSGVGLKGQTAAAGTIYHALTGEVTDATAFILPTAISGLSLIPADRNLTGAEVELVMLPEREGRLRALLQALRADFDYIFIDTPPSLGLLTLNALVAADAVLIPLNCEYFALEGLADLVATLRRVRAFDLYGDGTDTDARGGIQTRRSFSHRR
jgi:chromosome partitioning protein